MSSRWPLALAAALVALATVETAASLVRPTRVASDGDWRAAADEVRAGFHEGDLIAFAPAWADQTGRRWLGDLIPRAIAGRSSDDRFARVWVVSIRGGTYAETPATSPAIDHAHGRVRVQMYNRTSVAVGEDFTADLSAARVTQVPTDGSGDERPCFAATPDGRNDRDDGFTCASTRVGRRTLEIDYRPRLGVLVPADGALTTRLEWPAIAMGKELRVWSGIHDYYARKNADAPAQLSVLVDGVPQARVEVNNRGWQPLSVDTRAFAGTTHAVRFDISARAPAWRNVGFHAEVRP